MPVGSEAVGDDRGVVAAAGADVGHNVRRFELEILDELAGLLFLLAFRPIHPPRLIVTDDQFTHAAVQFEPTNAAIRARLRPLLARRRRATIPVVTGFVGATPDGRTTTIGRNGSDYSAAIVGAALGAAAPPTSTRHANTKAPATFTSSTPWRARLQAPFPAREPWPVKPRACAVRLTQLNW